MESIVRGNVVLREGRFARSIPFRGQLNLSCLSERKKCLADQILFDNTWGEVIIDYVGGGSRNRQRHLDWRNKQELLVISLDEIRKEKGISPSDSYRQEEVIQEARERARIHLRSKQSFVRNVGNHTQNKRRKLTKFLEQYRARVHTVYLETDRDSRRQRNSNRQERVPEDMVGIMLRIMVPPMPDEAQIVEWIFV